MDDKFDSLSDMPKSPCGPAGQFKKADVSGRRIYEPVLDQEKCVECLLCWVFCPHGAVKREKNRRISIDLNACKGCGICENVCPQDAIEMREVKSD